MRHLYFLLFLTCYCLLSGEPFRLLSVGNSLTNDTTIRSSNGLREYFGTEPYIVRYHIGCNKSLRYLWHSREAPCVSDYVWWDVIDDEPWDAVTLQPFDHGSGDQEDPTPDNELEVDAFMNFVREVDKWGDPVIYMYATWPNISLSSESKDKFSVSYQEIRYNHSSGRIQRRREFFIWFYKTVKARMLQEGITLELDFIPAGEVLLEASKWINAGRLPGADSVNDLYRDHIHMSEGLGKYLVSLTVYSVVRDIDPETLITVPGFFAATITAEQAAVCRQIVKHVLSGPYRHPDTMPVDFTARSLSSSNRVVYEWVAYSGMDYQLQYTSSLSEPFAPFTGQIYRRRKDREGNVVESVTHDDPWLSGDGDCGYCEVDVSEGGFFRVVRQ